MLAINLEEMARAYMAAALWSSTDEDGEPLDSGRDWNDISEESQAAMRQDCELFAGQNGALIFAFMAALKPSAEYSASAQVGHDFWLTRNGHGAGFWDRGTGLPGDALSELVGYSTAWPPVDLYVGDDGKVWQA